MKKKLIICLSLIICCSFLLAGCGKKETNGNNVNSDTANSNGGSEVKNIKPVLTGNDDFDKIIKNSKPITSLYKKTVNSVGDATYQTWLTKENGKVVIKDLGAFYFFDFANRKMLAYDKQSKEVRNINCDQKVTQKINSQSLDQATNELMGDKDKPLQLVCNSNYDMINNPASYLLNIASRYKNIKKIGTEKVAGKTCTVFSYSDASTETKLCLWEEYNLALKLDMNFSYNVGTDKRTMNTTETVTEIRVNEAKDSAFKKYDVNGQKLLDSDNDGLNDFEEEIYSTDPSKIDTDGDGYSDGEEAKKGYNPNGPGNLPE